MDHLDIVEEKDVKGIAALWDQDRHAASKMPGLISHPVGLQGPRSTGRGPGALGQAPLLTCELVPGSLGTDFLSIEVSSLHAPPPLEY